MHKNFIELISELMIFGTTHKDGLLKTAYFILISVAITTLFIRYSGLLNQFK